jgi:hypothetical protein
MARPKESGTGRRAAAPADPPAVRDEGVIANPATERTAAKQRAASTALPRAEGPKGRRAKGESYDETAKKRRAVRETDRLQDDLRAFAAARPSGWDHADWLTFLDTLKERGHDTSVPERIGLELERERLAVVLAGIPGVGPRRVDALVRRFDTLWSARQASVDEIATVPGIPRALAERVGAAVRAAGA